MPDAKIDSFRRQGNIALDVLLKRTPHYEKSARVLILSEKREIDAYISASAVTDIYYITRKALTDLNAYESTL